MEHRYRKVVEDARKLFVAGILPQEPELEQQPLRLDERMRELTRELGREVVGAVNEELSRRATQRAVKGGLTVQRRPEIELLTLFGVVTLRSPYLWNPLTHESARPVKTDLGMAHRKRTPALERALTDFGAEESFGQADRRLQEHYGFCIGRTTLLRVVQGHARHMEVQVGKRLEQATREFEKPPDERPGVARMLTELDGCEIRTGTLAPTQTDERTVVRKLPKRKRNEAWREVRVGLAHLCGADGLVSCCGGSAFWRGVHTRTIEPNGDYRCCGWRPRVARRAGSAIPGAALRSRSTAPQRSFLRDRRSDRFQRQGAGILGGPTDATDRSE